MNVNTHKKSKSDYEKNNDKIMFNKIEKNKRPSKVNEELIRRDLSSKNHNDGANNKKRTRDT